MCKKKDLRNLLGKRKERKERRMDYLTIYVRRLNSQVSEIEARIDFIYNEIDI